MKKYNVFIIGDSQPLNDYPVSKMEADMIQKTSERLNIKTEIKEV